MLKHNHLALIKVQLIWKLSAMFTSTPSGQEIVKGNILQTWSIYLCNLFKVKSKNSLSNVFIVPVSDSVQQERLLLSILPKHIADEMLQDMKKEPSQKEMQQFNTMYMYRHENVR